MTSILAADVGGTKIRLGLFDRSNDSLQLIKEEVLPSREFSSLEELLDYFLGENGPEIDSACFGVAGPVKGDTVRLTNLPWQIDAGRIKRTFRFNSLALINDLQATTYAIPWLTDQDIEVLKPGVAFPDGSLAVIAPGTGLGMAFMVRAGEKNVVAPSEGGHASFAPDSALELELLDYYQKKMGQVSYEDFCSGGGLPRIYEFLKIRGGYSLSESIPPDRLNVDDPAPVIVEEALHRGKQCPLCRAAVELFCGILAGACSRLALTVLARGGLYIAGGIPPRILPFLREEAFLERFTENRRMGALLENIPVKVILNHRAPLLGAAARALNSV